MRTFLHSFRPRHAALVAVVMVMAILGHASGLGNYLLTSVLNTVTHAPFDGTTYPVQKVPNWVKLPSDKWKVTYSEIEEKYLVNMPFYKPEELTTPTETLKWGDPKDDAVRVAKITYSVPYLGNYLLDGKEYAGSHPAVDIKIPTGTPVFAIANAAVIKVSEKDSGFGYHVVLQHNGMPSLSNAGASETLYSSYSHLSSISVKEGDSVTRGQQIALSGATGTATTPHLHFQIDNTAAPWHPYWPFTWQEAFEAGYDFFSAINNGLGKDKALLTTIPPMQYVQAYLNGTVTVTPPSDSSKSASSYVESVESTVDTSTVSVEAAAEPVLNFVIKVKPKYYTTAPENADFSVELRDQYGKLYNSNLEGDTVILSEYKRVSIAKPLMLPFHFNPATRSLDNHFKALTPGKDRLQVVYQGKTVAESEWFEVIDGAAEKSFHDLGADSPFHDAVVYLSGQGIVSGYPDGSFRPSQTVSRTEALKLILEGIDAELSVGTLPFSDVSSTEWYSKYLYTAFSAGVVDGHPDGRFKPSDTVNRAEFYKILFNAMKVQIAESVSEAPFSDVAVNSWYAPYLAYAKEIGVIDPSLAKALPGEQMTRGEVAQAMYTLMHVLK